MTRYLLLAFLWIAWCALHSAMISLSVTGALEKKFPGAWRWYRLFFNAVAVGTLVPVLLYAESLRGPVLFSWTGPWRIVQLLLIGAALLFFVAGARRYDFFQFLGMRQLKEDNGCSVLTDDCTLDTGGILSAVRHPWYTGGMLVVWARPLDTAAIFTNLVVSGYFVVGAFLEERKLKRQFGTAYTAYQKRVSMFFPVRWLREKSAVVRRS
jgi:protein-S-isoprenylcysteine O-methyltransferase Ste14